MSLRSSRMYGAAVPTMPPGLVELMEGLAKDVLKNSPDNIYEFCAQHMKKLIEIRDGKERKNDSPSIEKVTKVQENDQGKTEINQKLDDTDIEAVKVNEPEEAEASKNETDEKQIDEEFLNDSHESEKENESEQKHIDESTIGSNTVESANNENNSKDFEIKSLGTKEQILLELPESQNKNSLDTNSSNENLVLLVGDNEIANINEPVCNTNTENDDYSTNEANLLETDFVSKDKNELQSTKALDLQSDDQSVVEIENTEYNLNLNNDLDNLNSPQKDSSGNEKVLNESNGIHTESCINELSFPNEDYSHVNIDRAIDSPNLEEKLHLQKSNENEDYSRDRSIDVDNDAASSMDLEKAAITIQKVFRAFLFKSKTLSTEEVTNIDLNYLVDNDEKEAVKDPSVMNKERRSGISRMDTVLQTVNEEKSLSLSTDDSSTLSSAATIIQAHVRGFLVRCKMPFNKTVSTVSVLDSDVPSAASLDSDHNQQVNKTILNIHIVPEGNNFISRDESLITSLDVSLDGSPRQSSSLHPLGYDISERRKQLKREDAIQSVTPPSNNSGKLSEEVDSVKEIVLNDSTDEPNLEASEKNDELKKDDHLPEFENHSSETRLEISKSKFIETRNITSDEADVVTPFVTDSGTVNSSANDPSKLLHSGEFHDIVLPTVVSRSNSSVVRGE
ncbi:uncharacterized protein LOC121726577 isoform X2 [Aricia agestis]|uniref:uncharacterized protein LOC121726577 isoform X2 n=1 Tax=Aricia agestis TaxID=91739 RepID=UPI001C20775B|nr:uncharacterized protein LOC121726577 isoform X2 [Aricia agestis]